MKRFSILFKNKKLAIIGTDDRAEISLYLNSNYQYQSGFHIYWHFEQKVLNVAKEVFT